MLKNILNLGDAAVYCDFGEKVNQEINTNVINIIVIIEPIILVIVTIIIVIVTIRRPIAIARARIDMQNLRTPSCKLPPHQSTNPLKKKQKMKMIINK